MNKQSIFVTIFWVQFFLKCYILLDYDVFPSLCSVLISLLFMYGRT